MRVEAAGVTVPDLDGGARQRLAVGVVDGAVHDQRMAVRIRAVVEAGKAVRDRRAGHIERSFDRAWSRVVDAEFRVDRIEALVKEVVEAQAGRNQACLPGRADIVEPGDGRSSIRPGLCRDRRSP